MLEPYRRHLKTCPDREKGAHYIACNCPIWVFGRLDGQTKPIRQSLGTRDLRRAYKRIETWERGEAKQDQLAIAPTLSDAVAAYLLNCENRRLAAATQRSYHTLFCHLIAFGGETIRVDDITFATLEAFRNQRAVEAPAPRPRSERRRARTLQSVLPPKLRRKVSASTINKETQNLRAFFAYCVDQEWIEKNPAKKLKHAHSDSTGALPFTRPEVARILAAVDDLDCPNQPDAARARFRARAMVLTFLATGYRCGDVAALRRDQFDHRTGYLTVRYTEKTHVPVRVHLKPETIQALGELPVENPAYFFWSGRSALGTIKRSIARTFIALSRLTGIHVHAHRFRDTLASEVLLAGGEIRTLQKILGHKSVKTTEKYYGHFVLAHQKLLDSAVDAVPAWIETGQVEA